MTLSNHLFKSANAAKDVIQTVFFCWKTSSNYPGECIIHTTSSRAALPRLLYPLPQGVFPTYIQQNGRTALNLIPNTTYGHYQGSTAQTPFNCPEATMHCPRECSPHMSSRRAAHFRSQGSQAPLGGQLLQGSVYSTGDLGSVMYPALYTVYSVQCMCMVHCTQFTVYSGGVFIICCTVHSLQCTVVGCSLYGALYTVHSIKC